jgi:hypothetical protein
MLLRFTAFAILAVTIASPAFAQSAPDPCAAFPWRLDKEKILLSEAAGTTVYAGSYLDRDPPIGFRMMLRPVSSVAFVQSPEGRVASQGYGGVLKLGSPTTHGEFLVTLSNTAAVDVIQGSGALPLADYAVARKCPEVRESLKFVVNSGRPLTLQISGAAENSIDVAITPAWYFNARPPGVP